MPTCGEIIESLPGRFNQEAAGDWTATIQFKIAGDEGGSGVLKVADGACSVESGEVEEATATLHTDAATWVGINTGSVNPMQAFMMGQIRIEGNMGEVLKLNNPAIFPRG